MGIKKTVLAVVAMLVMMTATCFAQITEEDLNIGGIYYGQPMEEVVAKYGEPVRKEPRAPKGYDPVFIVNGSEMVIRFFEEKVVFASGKLKTPAGIMAGASVNDIISIYGKPDSFDEIDKGLLHIEYYTPKIYPVTANSNWEYYNGFLRFIIYSGVTDKICMGREYKTKEILMP